MELYFDHVAGQMTDCDWMYSHISATFEPSEYDWAIHHGWLINEWEPPYWFQGRQVRIDLNQYEYRKVKWPKHVYSYFTDLERADLDQLQTLYDQYAQYKKFDDHLSIKDTCSLDPQHKKIFRIEDRGELVAYSIVRTHPIPVSLQFVWNYHNPKYSFGYLCQKAELNAFKKWGHTHLYLCPGYELTCLWKLRFHGFEWWTGRQWSTDKGEFERLCRRDSTIESVKELSGL